MDTCIITRVHLDACKNTRVQLDTSIKYTRPIVWFFVYAHLSVNIMHAPYTWSKRKVWYL